MIKYPRQKCRKSDSVQNIFPSQLSLKGLHDCFPWRKHHLYHFWWYKTMMTLVNFWNLCAKSQHYHIMIHFNVLACGWAKIFSLTVEHKQLPEHGSLGQKWKTYFYVTTAELTGQQWHLDRHTKCRVNSLSKLNGAVCSLIFGWVLYFKDSAPLAVPTESTRLVF